MWQDDAIQPNVAQAALKVGRVPRLPRRRYRPAPVLQLSGPGYSSFRSLLGDYLLAVSLDAQALVEVQTFSAKGWTGLNRASGVMHQSEQLIRFSGELVRLHSAGTGTVALRRKP